MNPEFLQKLNDAYDETSQKYADDFTEVQCISTADNEGSTKQSTAFQVATAILECLRHKVER